MFAAYRHKRDGRVMAQLIYELEQTLKQTPEVSPEINMQAFYERKEMLDVLAGLKLIAQLLDLNISQRPTRSERHRASFFARFHFKLVPSRVKELERTIGRQRVAAIKAALYYLGEQHVTIGDLMASDPELSAV